MKILQIKTPQKNKDRIEYLEKWLERNKNEDLLSDNVSLHSVSEIRSKMTPFATLLAIVENDLVNKNQKMQTNLLDTCKRMLNELCEREKYSR